MSVRVRRFVDADAEAVSRIMFDSFMLFLAEHMQGESPKPPEYWRNAVNRLDGDSEIAGFVAEDGGKAVGFLLARAMKKNGLGALEVIGVAPECVSAGVGTALFREAEAFWKGLRMRKVYTCVSAHNTRALMFYLKRGFRPEGVQREHFHPGVDEINLAIFYRDP